MRERTRERERERERETHIETLRERNREGSHKREGDLGVGQRRAAIVRALREAHFGEGSPFGECKYLGGLGWGVYIIIIHKSFGHYITESIS